MTVQGICAVKSGVSYCAAQGQGSQVCLRGVPAVAAAAHCTCFMHPIACASLLPPLQEIRKAGGSGVLVSPMTYIFDEEPPRWKNLLSTLGKTAADVPEL